MFDILLNIYNSNAPILFCGFLDGDAHRIVNQWPCCIMQTMKHMSSIETLHSENCKGGSGLLSGLPREDVHLSIL